MGLRRHLVVTVNATEHRAWVTHPIRSTEHVWNWSSSVVSPSKAWGVEWPPCLHRQIHKASVMQDLRPHSAPWGQTNVKVTIALRGKAVTVSILGLEGFLDRVPL